MIKSTTKFEYCTYHLPDNIVGTENKRLNKIDNFATLMDQMFELQNFYFP